MPISSWPGLSRPSTSLLRTPPHKQGVDARHKVGYDDQTESPLMDSINSEVPAAPAPVIRTEPPPRVWKFWGTALWGLFIFAAMFVGQIAVVAWFVLWREGPIDIAAAIHVVGGGLTISLSVIMGLPAVLAALWLAIRVSRTSFADYLALRGTSWTNFLIGAIALFV